MKNIAKITLAILTSIALSTVSYAGELSVTGSAKATYTIVGSETANAKSEGGKGIGIANEFSLSASGELDNGYTWSYAQDIDNATVQDDAKMTVTTPYGTIGAFVSEGSLSTKYKNSQAAYAAGSDFGKTSQTSTTKHDSGSATAAWTYGDNISNLNNLQYHSPADVLPLGASVKVAYAPTAVVNANASSNSVSGSEPTNEDGTNATEYQVMLSPIDGLGLNASYFEKGNQRALATVVQKYEAGCYGANYAISMVTVGYGNCHIAPALAAQTTAIYTQHYENEMFSIGVAVNDALSLSYEEEMSTANKQTVTENQVKTDTDIESKISTIQAAYTAGGMTMSVSSKEVDNANYTQAVDFSETVFAVSMAF
jgi:hypothetical protein